MTKGFATTGVVKMAAKKLGKKATFEQQKT